MGPLRIDIGLTFWTVFTFVGLLILLSRYAFTPLRKLLEERERRIRESLEQAERARKQAQEILIQNQAQLEQARDEARRIITEGQKIAADIQREAKTAAQKEADAVLRAAQAEIACEIQKSLDELKFTVANLALRITRQVIKETLDERRHEQLAEEFIQRLKASHGARQS